MVMFCYRNAAYPDHEANLWECHGKIVFQSADTTSAWHGSFEVGDHKDVNMRFDWRGRGRGKTVKLLYTGLDDEDRETWQGWDYRGRQIDMTKMRAYGWDPYGECWHPL